MIDYQEPIKPPVVDKAPITDSTRKNEDMDIMPTYVETPSLNNKIIPEIHESITEEDIKERFGQRITAESYQGLNIPHDTREQKDIFGENIVMTIDDCYDHNTVRFFFETLKKNGHTATFFPNTEHINIKNEDVIKLWREIYEEGFEIGYHTTNHTARMTQEELSKDFEEFTLFMRELLGDSNFSIKTVRPPYGLWDDEWDSWVEKNNLFNITWNMDVTRDASYANGLIYRGISPIILLHPKEEDVNWLKQNIRGLNWIVEQKDSSIGSVYSSIPKTQDDLRLPTPEIEISSIKRMINKIIKIKKQSLSEQKQ